LQSLCQTLKPLCKDQAEFLERCAQQARLSGLLESEQTL
jgi:hypothetical protein